MQVQSFKKQRLEKRYDLKFLYDYYGDDLASLREVLLLFLQETPELLLDIGRHLKAGSMEQARAATHKIKTNLAMLGIADRAGFMDHLHRAPDTGERTGETELLFTVFCREVELALSEIRADFF